MLDNMIINGDKILKGMEEDLITFQAELLGREFNTMLAEMLKTEEAYSELVEKIGEEK